MRAEAFAMRETLRREDLDRHPVWAPFRAGDRDWILGWGVRPERLDDELERYDYCGPEPLFPVLDLEKIPDREDLVVAARVTLADRSELPGYRLAPHVVGVFAQGREWVFNRSLPARACSQAAALARALGTSPEGVLPLRYRCRVSAPEGTAIEGVFALPNDG